MLLLVIMWSRLVGAQSNGDIRVVQNPNDTYTFIKDDIWGRLEVYLNGECAKADIQALDSIPMLLMPHATS